MIFKYSATALPKITPSKHKIHTPGNVLLITMTIADCSSKSTNEGSRSIFPVMPGSIAKQNVIMKNDRSATMKYPKTISFKSTIKIPDNVLIKKRDG